MKFFVGQRVKRSSEYSSPYFEGVIVDACGYGDRIVYTVRFDKEYHPDWCYGHSYFFEWKLAACPICKCNTLGCEGECNEKV